MALGTRMDAILETHKKDKKTGTDRFYKHGGHRTEGIYKVCESNELYI